MRILKKYGLIAVLIIPIILMVIIRLSNTNHFKPDAQKWAESSIEKSNILSVEQLGQLTGDKLLISDNIEVEIPLQLNLEANLISFETILEEHSLKTIRKHEGPILVYSNETSVSARIWMFISQMGYKDVFIIQPTS